MTAGRGLVAAGVLVGLAAGVPSCSRDRKVSPPAAGRPGLVHATGLVLAAPPPEFQVRETPTGFRVDPANARSVRNPWSLDLRLTGEDPPGAAETRKIDDRDAHYRLEVDPDAGSGGPLHTLTAWIACGSRRIVLIATQQAEPPERPDWTPAWAVLAASRCLPPG